MVPLLPNYSADERLDDLPHGASTVQAEPQERPIGLVIALPIHDASSGQATSGGWRGALTLAGADAYSQSVNIPRN